MSDIPIIIYQYLTIMGNITNANTIGTIIDNINPITCTAFILMFVVHCYVINSAIISFSSFSASLSLSRNTNISLL